MENPCEEEWLSIDVGIVHLALVMIRVNTVDWQLQQIVWHQLIDIRRLGHDVVPQASCGLGHTKTITDRMAHVYQEHAALFNRAVRILVERQPITGLQAVQESLFAAYRQKLQFVSPNQMHKALKLRGNYESRKQYSVNLARHYFYSKDNSLFPAGKATINADPAVAERFENYLDKLNKRDKRSHDVADAICMVVFVLQNEAEELRKRRHKEDLASRIPGDLNQYKRAKPNMPIRFLKHS